MKSSYIVSVCVCMIDKPPTVVLETIKHASIIVKEGEKHTKKHIW